VGAEQEPEEKEAQGEGAAPDIALEQFAELSAEVEAEGDRGKVIAAAGLSAESWSETQEAWLGRIAADAAVRRFELGTRYTTAYVARQKDLRDNPKILVRAARRKPKGAAGGEPARVLTVPPPPPVEAEAPAPRVAAPPAPVLAELPDPMATAPSPPVVASPPESEQDETIIGRSPFFMAALPFAPSAAAPPPRRSAGTGLPFAFVEAPAPESSRPSTGLPFAPAPAADPEADARAARVAYLDADTAPPQPSPLSALPFRRAPAAAPAQAGEPASGPPSSTRAGLPFRAPAPPASPSLTLEQFTSLTAEIAQSPAAIGAVRARYGLDEPAHRRQAEEWQRRFAADGELYARYTAMFQSYREWLARSR
jgi:hypothetical protein